MKAPTGLGAVVEDSEGRLWVRADDEEPEWRCTKFDAARGLRWGSYADITAVRVLSEGVTR